jgi:hypothetical protein
VLGPARERGSEDGGGGKMQKEKAIEPDANSDVATGCRWYSASGVWVAEPAEQHDSAPTAIP